MTDHNSKLVRECLEAEELGDGILFSELNGGQFLYNQSSLEWFKWEGHHWTTDVLDTSLAAVEMVAQSYAKELGKVLRGENDNISPEYRETLCKKLSRRIRRLRREAGRQNVRKFAAANPVNALGTSGDVFDQDPWLLACANGVLDLRTGELRPGRPGDFISMASPVEWDDVEAKCSAWEKTLDEIFGADRELIKYVQRVFGYACTGLSKENVLPVLWGQGRNGKTTIVETISRILGPLAKPIQSEMLLDQGRSRSSAGPSPDIMSLRGLRMAFASEVDQNRKFSPSRIKWLSGSDTLVGRSPHDRRETCFQPTHTLFLLTNHKPHAPASEFALWERIHLIPFNFSFVDRDPQADNEFRADKDLSEKLEKEASGILAWLVRGTLKWIQLGLAPPKIIRDATAEYRRDEDVLADFLEECCHLDPGARESFSNLYQRFETWFAKNESKWVPSPKRFGQLLKAKFKPDHSNGRRYIGIRLMN